jgi:uncharacterized short protein YbdD (DUF466 family)
MLDVVIPVGPSDIDIIHDQIKYTKQNIIGLRNIYVVSPVTNTNISGVILVSESIFPFSIQDVASKHGATSRNGWYLQQLIKLYVGSCIPDILQNYLVIDADTFFLKPTTFLQDGVAYLNSGYEYHAEYFDHMRRLHPSFIRYMTCSGITHHMLFNTEYVEEMRGIVEEYHKKPFWEVFLEQVNTSNNSGASEYEMYSNFMYKIHPDKVMLRSLKWANKDKLVLNEDYDYVSVHWYMRT